jgi:cytoskeletal protein CcmA (bactofilin family)
MASCIGQTILVKGQLLAAEDIHIAGRVEGEILLQEHVLIVQPTADLNAEVAAKSVVIQGAVRGDIIAGHSIALQQSASVAGTLAAPRIAINDGASFNGKVETIRES